MTDPIPTAPASQAEPKGARVEVRGVGGKTSVLPIDPDGTVIGRSEEARVRLPSEAVSRRHAEMFRDKLGRWWLRDLGSVNGTWVEGRVVTETVLGSGDRFEIGGYLLRLLDREDAGRPEPPSTTATTLVGDTPSLPLRELPNAHIATLSEVAAPKIDTTHLITINEFARRLSAMRDPKERLGELCRLMVRQVFHGSSAVVVRLWFDDVQMVPEVIGAPQIRSGTSDPLPYLSRSLLRVVRETQSPALAAHGSTDPGAVKMTIVSPQEDIAAIACPVRREAGTIDVLYVTLPAAFGSGEWLTLIAHASQTFELIETALDAQRQLEVKAAMERDLKRASTIQRSLVPGGVAVRGLEIAIGFEPCRWVGGDYVDVLQTADGRTLLAIADVCGKGLPAAMVSSTIHSMVHLAQRAGIDLPHLMAALNDHLCRFLEEQTFVTMACVLLDGETGSFELVNTGHPAPVVIAPDGSFIEMQSAANYPLGILPFDVVFQGGGLQPGHLLGLFTDGLTELNDEHGKQLGPTRLAEHLGEMHAEAIRDDLPLDRVKTRLEALLDHYQGDRLPTDDRTFLLVRRDGAGPERTP